jgi:hypothetical protein
MIKVRPSPDGEEKLYCFVTSLWLLSLENDVNVPSKSSKKLRKLDPQHEIELSKDKTVTSTWCSLKKVETKEPASPVVLARLELSKSEVEEQILQFDRLVHGRLPELNNLTCLEIVQI